MKADVSTRKIDELVEFIGRAEKLGKYPKNSAVSIRGSLLKAAGGLQPEEPRTIGYLLEHVQELFGRQDLNLSAESVAVYIVRIKRAVSDFGEHGLQPGAIYNWQAKVKISKKPQEKKIAKKEEVVDRSDSEENDGAVTTRQENGVRLNKLSWRLRPGVVIRVELPEDLTENDVNKIKALLDVEIKF